MRLHTPAVIALAAALHCAPPPSTSPEPIECPSREHLGRQVVVEGWAVEQAVGPAVNLGGCQVWIDSLDTWPDGYYTRDGQSARVQVTGTLVEDHGLPVFVAKDGEVRHGIPVPEGTDLDSASHRYLIRGARWQVVAIGMKAEQR